MSFTDKFRPPAKKACNTCKEEKPIKEFSRTAKSPDGFNWSCRACKKAYDESKKEQGKERAKTFFDAKFFTLALLLSTSAAFSQVKYAICYHNTPACKCSSGEVVVRDTVIRHTPDTAWWIKNPPFSGCLKLCAASSATNIPDTSRAILLVTLSPNGIAHARMGFIVRQPGKPPVYLDCRKRALKWPQVGWDFREVDLNYKK